MRRRDLLTGSAAMMLSSAMAPSGAAAQPASGVAAAQLRLATRLIDALGKARPAGENVIVSPAGLAAVLAMLASEADDTMRAAIAAALGGAALDELRAKVASVAHNGGPFALANALAVDPSSRPREEALARLRAGGTEVTVERLSDPAVVRRLNDWVAARTKGNIRQILDAPPHEAGLIALSALYFKDSWRARFDPAATRRRPFHGLGGAKRDVMMMAGAATRRYREDERFLAVDLPYQNERFSLVVVTTREVPAPAGGFAPAAGWLSGDNFTSASVDLALPRFTIRHGAELLAALDALGLKDGRRSPTAFARLSPVPQQLSRIVQRSYLKVDEEGTEAASATAAITTRSAPARQVKIVIDKPFVFALRDRTSGLVLMAGYVGSLAGSDAVAEN